MSTTGSVKKSKKKVTSTPRTPRLQFYNIELSGTPDAASADHVEQDLKGVSRTLSNQFSPKKQDEIPVAGIQETNDKKQKEDKLSAQMEHDKHDATITSADKPSNSFPLESINPKVLTPTSLYHFILWALSLVLYSFASLMIYLDVHILSRKSEKRATLISLMLGTFLLLVLSSRLISSNVPTTNFIGSPSDPEKTEFYHTLAKKLDHIEKSFPEIEKRVLEHLQKRLSEQQQENMQLINSQKRHMEIELEKKIDEQLKRMVNSESKPLAAAELRQAIEDYIVGVTKPDYALQSVGGSIVLSQTSPSYVPKSQSDFSLSGVARWISSFARRGPYSNPNAVIQSDNTPGNCWAFEGNRGFITIRLAMPIRPESFSLEHIPGSIAFNTSSSPRRFNVWGLQHENDEDAMLLGEYEYKLNGPKLVQNFPVKPLKNNEQVPVFPLINLQILSNYGNEEFSCIYRFRVHGKPEGQLV